ncbi:hypothetical protein CQW23_10253 [Capsicum baccatum]|uniref:Ubiquitin-like protease family profile domain-containing protein n=1 Tax=Capsicum baccatum TaxID=33114 RepID=A0A2G2WZ32_CAPBA|nr:hypothetical protein CQW23_10253 [Capsicum baccatum]
MEDCPSFSLGLIQLDANPTNPKVGFVPAIFDYEEPNFDENKSKYHNDPNKMKEIKKVVAEKSKNEIGESSRKSKNHDTARPRLPKFVYNNIRPTHEEMRSLDLQMIEKFELNDDEFGFSPETTVGRSGKRLVIDIQSQSGHDIQGFEDFSTPPPTKILKKADIDFVDDLMDVTILIGTAVPYKNSLRLDVLVRFVVNQNSTNLNVGTPSTMYINKYHVDVEGVSADIGPATLKFLSAVLKNIKPDSANVGTSTKHVDYSSTLPESAQVELDVILEGIAAPVDDLPIEVVPSSEAIVNKHDIFDSQLPPDFPDAVVAAHQDAKTPAKRTRTRFKVFMSLYTTEYASGSKAIEDQIEEPKQKFAFDGFLIFDNMPRGVIEEYKQWVEKGLLKFHAKKKINDEHYKAKLSSLEVHEIDFVFAHARTKNWFYLMSQKNACWNDEHQVDEVYVHINCNEKFHWVLAVIALKDRRIRVYDSLSSLRNMHDGNCEVLVVGYAEYLSEGINVSSDGFEAEYHRMHYATLLQTYGIQKAQKGYFSENDDPPRPRSRNIRILDENKIVSIE